MWQKCPICDGEGRVTSNGLSSSVHQVCPTCNGARIISELNGLPAQASPTVSKMEIAQTAMTKLFTNLESMGITIPQGVEMIYLRLEKEQIMKAVYDSMGANFDPNMGRAEQYYNETFGGQGSPDTSPNTQNK